MNTPASVNDKCLVQLPEIIDEKADLGKLFEITNKKIHVDCSNVARINSVGIRNFKTSLSRLHKEGAQFIFEGVTSPLVEAFEFISDLLPHGAEIASVILPYFCSNCKQSLVLLCPLDELKQNTGLLNSTDCTICGEDAIFDHLPEVYLNAIMKPSST